MSSPLSSADQNQIQKVDDQLAHCIKRAIKGKDLKKELFNIEKNLSQLASNENIPSGVREKLQGALNELKQMQSGQVNLNTLSSAKQQLDSALGGRSEGGEVGGGSLGSSEQ
jgi:hypothetical protein